MSTHNGSHTGVVYFSRTPAAKQQHFTATCDTLAAWFPWTVHRDQSEAWLDATASFLGSRVIQADLAGFRTYMIGLLEREGRIQSAERVEAHLSVSSFSNLLSARLCGYRALR
jgi:hypothetical protein